MVQFAAGLPHRYKIKNIFSSRSNKYLQKRYYEKYMPSDIVWSKKKGMGWNLRWDLSIVHDPKFGTAFSKAFESLEAAGIQSGPFRKAWKDYVADITAGKRSSLHASPMMNGFMLGAWLMRDYWAALGS